MEIFINSQKLEFELENEKTLKDVSDGIQRWLNSDNKVITKINADGKDYDIDNESMRRMALNNVKTIKFDVIPAVDLAIESLQDAREYLKKLLQNASLFSNEIDEVSCKNFIEGLELVLTVIGRSKSILKSHYDEAVDNDIKSLDDNLNKVRKLFDKQEFREISRIIKTNLKPQIQKWADICNSIISDYISKRSDYEYQKSAVLEQLHNNISILPSITSSLEEITTSLQTGQDKKAMKSLQDVTGIIENIISILKKVQTVFGIDYAKFLHKGKSVEEKIVEVMNLLKQVISAFENNDIVLLCDLLSYELFPKLEELVGIMELIESQINSKS